MSVVKDDAVGAKANRHAAPEPLIEPIVVREPNSVRNIAGPAPQHDNKFAGIERDVAGALENRVNAAALASARDAATDRLGPQLVVGADNRQLGWMFGRQCKGHRDLFFIESFDMNPARNPA
jgi:hypothetical protein